MEKVTWKPGTMLYPLPAVMVSCGTATEGYNIVTVAWTGIINTNPPMCYISLRKSRHSHYTRLPHRVWNDELKQLTD